MPGPALCTRVVRRSALTWRVVLPGGTACNRAKRMLAALAAFAPAVRCLVLTDLAATRNLRLLRTDGRCKVTSTLPTASLKTAASRSCGRWGWSGTELAGSTPRSCHGLTLPCPVLTWSVLLPDSGIQWTPIRQVPPSDLRVHPSSRTMLTTGNCAIRFGRRSPAPEQ
eukprot:3194722-Rhodomonas_salina.2